MKNYIKLTLGVCLGLSPVINYSFGQTNTNGGNLSGNGGSGSHNTFYGYAAGQSNTSGSNNTFIGSSAGQSNLAGDKNVFIGWYAGNATQNGYNNVFLGSKSGKSNVSGFRNTYIGPGAGLSNISGYQNNALGYLAGRNNQYGIGNLYLGTLAGYSNLGSYNVFIGNQAGYYETGSDKLYIDNSNTSSPLIYGDFAQDHITINGGLGVTGGISGSSLYLSGAGGVNFQLREETVSGCSAAKWHFEVGRICGVGPIPPAPFPFMTLSHYGDGSTQHRIGIGTTAPQEKLHVNGKVLATDFLTNSDKRLKKDFEPIHNAGELVRQLEGVTYTYQQNLKEEGRNLPEGKHIGFIAQDVQKVIPEIVAEDEEGYLSVSYQSLIPLLVESQKELKIQNDELRDQLTESRAANEALALEVEKIKEILATLTDDVPSRTVQLDGTTEEMLHQNAPNPFSEVTTIEYNLPAHCTETKLLIMDSNGKLVQSIEQLETGRGQVVLQANSLTPGTYRYMLVCQGQTLASKSMVIVQ